MNAQKIIIETAILKQTTINCLPLPDLVLAEIKDYLFYDRHASKQIKDTRKHKSNILDKIENAYTREKHTQEIIEEYYNDCCKYNRDKMMSDDSESLEEFLDRCDLVSGTFTFQIDGSQDSIGTFGVCSYFCIGCGNYTYTGIGNNNLHHRCKCLCVDNDDDDYYR